jgi:hypothetical protein
MFEAGKGSAEKGIYDADAVLKTFNLEKKLASRFTRVELIVTISINEVTL